MITGPGASVIPAQPKPSAMRENPGPDVDVEDLSPACAAPVAMLIAEISSAACLDFRDCYRLYTPDHHSLSRQWLPSQFCRKGFFTEAFSGVVVSMLCRADVQVTECGLSACEPFSDGFGGEIEVVIGEA